MILGQLPTPPLDTPVSSAGQAIMSVGVAVGIVAIVVALFRVRRRIGTWAPALLPASTFLAAFMCPIPDVVVNLWYYEPGATTLWTSFGASLPVWVFFSYTAFYGGFGLIFWWLAERGTDRATMVRAMGAMWVFAVLTEVGGIQFDTYEYYGPAPFRVLSFPIWVSLYNVSIIAVLGIGFARLRRWLPGRELVVPALFLGPAAIVSGLIGTGFPVINVVNTVDPSNVQLYGAALAALALAWAMAYTASRFVPPAGLPPIDTRPQIRLVQEATS